MKRILRLWYLCLLTLLLAAGCQSDDLAPVATEMATTAPATAPLPYRDPNLPVTDRVADLLARMTLAEKIGQMTLVEKNSIHAPDITTLAVGGLLSGGGGAPEVNRPGEWLAMVNGFQAYALATRLGIPLLYGIDAVHGHNNVYGAVLFPHNIGLGAANDPALMVEIGRVTAQEMTATGIYWNYAPAVSVPQDIRWGRTYEGYSENTDIVTSLSQAYLRGLQGDDLSAADTVIGTPKHFIGDGGTIWGTSTTGDYWIDQGDTQVDEATLRAVHLPPYVAAIDNGARSIMVSYSSWNGTKMHAQTYLITDVLKGELGFDGFVVSDWGAIDQIDGDYYAAVVAAINAGIDMNMVPFRYERFINTMHNAVANGDISEERIDDAVRRILTVKFELGLFDQPPADGATLGIIGSPDHREVARQAVRQSLVLLHHDGETLPLDRAAPVVFVGGEAAANIGLQAGGWSITWQGESGNTTPGTTVLAAVKDAVGGSSDVYFSRFGNFGQTDENGAPLVADVGIFVASEQPYAEGQGDSDELSLSESDRTVMARMREQSERLVVIIFSGRPVVLTDILPLSDAVIAAWLPGTEGAGITDVLFGDYEFSGRLPYTWPRSLDQLPFDFAALPAAGCGGPLFPFGYGLTMAEETPAEYLNCP